MIWVALASQLSLPLPVGVRDARAVFSAEDMPVYVQMQGVNRFVPTRTTVRPDGTLQDCTSDRGSGDPKLDTLTCSIILRRAQFTPATWTDGTPTYGVIRVPVSWVIGGYSKGEMERAFPPDMEIAVNKLPKGAGKRTNVRLTLAVEADGKISSCAEAAPLPEEAREKKFPELTPLACGQMTATFRAKPAKDSSGNPVRSVQPASVLLTIQK